MIVTGSGVEKSSSHIRVTYRSKQTYELCFRLGPSRPARFWVLGKKPLGGLAHMAITAEAPTLVAQVRTVGLGVDLGLKGPSCLAAYRNIVGP